MNPFVSRISGHSWEIPVSVLSLVLGVMVSLAWITEQNRPSRALHLDSEQNERIKGNGAPAAAVGGDVDVQKLELEIARQQKENTKLQNAMANDSNQTKLLNEQLQDTKRLAGLTDVEGPGVTITLRDSTKDLQNIATLDKIIHDTDVLKVVNELWASGAEAVTVNGHRVVSGTSFRCVGPVIHVEGVPIASPVIVRAIGDPKTLMGGMNLPGGVLDEIRQLDPAMVQIESVKQHHFPAYSGPTAKHYLTVPKESK